MKCKSLYVVLVAALALVFAAPAFAAGPVVTDLTSPTHPATSDAAYYSNDPSFTWSAAQGPLASIGTPGSALGVAVAGGFAYVGQQYQGLQVIDLVDPAAPSLRGQWTDDYPPGYVIDVVVRGDYAYVSNLYYGGSIIILDISDPDAPTYVGSAWGFDNAQEIALSGDYAFVASEWYGMQVVNVSDVTAPSVQGYYGEYCRGIDVQGNFAYLASYNGLTILDISSPTSPAFAGHVDMPQQAKQVVVSGDYAYVSTYASDGGADFRVVNVQDPSNPSVVGSCRVGGVPWDVALDGATAYVACGSSGIRAVDVSDSASPVATRTFATGGYARDIALDGGFAYVAAEGGGLAVIDLTAQAPRFGYSYALDQSADTVPGETVMSTAGEAQFTDCGNGTWWFHVRGVEVDADGIPVGEWGDTATFQVDIDHRPHITSLWSITHYAYEWTTNNDPQFEWLTDVSCDAYSYAIDQVDGQEPDNVADPVSDVDQPSVTFTDVPDGTWWFHVRALDAESNWGPAQQYPISIKTAGPVTMALSAKSAKRGAVVLQYSVHDFVNWGAAVSIEIMKAGGATVRTIDCGWREFDRVYATAVGGLAKGRYKYTVHAWDWLGNPESEAGTAGFTIR